MSKNLSLFTAIMLVAFLFTGCGAQKKSTLGNGPSSAAEKRGPSASEWKAGVKGVWILKSIEREDVPKAYTIKNIFDEAPVNCFLESIWNLPGGNHHGSISFNAEGQLCADGAQREIVWSIYDSKLEGEQPQFQLKKVYPGEKAKDVTNGYRLDLSYADEHSLEMRMPIPLDDGTGNLVFTFERYTN
ncbi:MAG TPA: hypothetical protein VK102_05275 [Sphingobacterium sp.]|nr:hypothetical protein [Sphingobacterium sp.]